MKRSVVGILCVAVTACVGPSIPIPMPTPDARKRLPSEIMDGAAVVPLDGTGAIVVTRDKTRFWRTRCTYDVAVDGQLMAGLRNGEQVTLYAAPGGRTLTVSIRPEESCEPATAMVPVNVVASATTTIRIVADVSFELRLEATTY